MSRFIGLAAALVLAAGSSSIGVTVAAAQAAEETLQGMLAAQIRLQGFACDTPISAVKEETQSRPDHAVWLLKCSNATYRVSRIPDMAAKVEVVQ